MSRSAVEIRVGPPVITINQGTTFLVSHHSGQIDTQSELGIFAGDTRFVSAYRLTINLRPWTVVSSSAVCHWAARWVFTNPEVPAEESQIPAGEIGLVLDRAVERGLHDDLDIVNYGQERRRFFLEVEIESDFADLFDVKRHRVTYRGETVTEWHHAGRELSTRYVNRQFTRTLLVRTAKATSPARHANGRMSFEVDLGPRATWHACMLFAFQGTDADDPARICHSGTLDDSAPHSRMHAEWHRVASRCRSSNQLVERTFLQSVEDVGALRIFDPHLPKDEWIPAAGLPWFMTLFGRDSLLVSLQNMLIHPLFARAALRRLADLQATELDDYRDAQPGKIMHEVRYGELAALHLTPHYPYYGSHDATSLYLIVLSEAYLWSGDLELVKDNLRTAERCLEWIDRYGDQDQDGFQEYRTRSPRGYRNQGWKDSGDGIVYPDGALVDPPIALCELQGYVYDAKIRMAHLYEELGQPERAAELRRQAADLKHHFNEAFWMPDEDFFALGLDAQKKQIQTIASNAGHCLWSGIVNDDRAAAVVHRLFLPDMWSGWGIRTLSTENRAYNPFSYQRGSVWPHDNGIIAAGFRRYGFPREAAQVAHAIFDAASNFAALRLPELYGGLPREEGGFPVQYLGANTPQAWAAGSVFMLLRAMLGIQADAPHERLYLDPWLPDWLPDIEVEGVYLGTAILDLRVRGREAEVASEISMRKGRASLIREFRYLQHK